MSFQGGFFSRQKMIKADKFSAESSQNAVEDSSEEFNESVEEETTGNEVVEEDDEIIEEDREDHSGKFTFSPQKNQKINRFRKCRNHFRSFINRTTCRT